MKTTLLLLFGVVLCSGCNYSDVLTSKKEMSCTGFDCLKNYVEKDDGAFEWKDTGKRLNGKHNKHCGQQKTHNDKVIIQLWSTNP